MTNYIGNYGCNKEWYQNGKLHRTDGPAIEYAAGDKYWYINGSKLPFNEFIIIAKWSNKRIVLWKLKHGQG